MTADAGSAEALSAVDWAHEPIVLYNGKFLWTKGVQVLLAAAPLVLERHPRTRFILVGFGSQRAWLEEIVDALDRGDLERLRVLFLRPREVDPEVDPDSSLCAEGLLEALEDQAFAEDYFEAARGRLRERVIFTGYLDHDRLRYLLPCAEVATAPSIFPEAFGLVAVEALACGVIPLLANHSGFSQVIREVVDEFAGTFDEERFKPLFLDSDLALNLANNINTFLEYYGEMYAVERRSIRRRARAVAEAKYAWPSIARACLNLS
jgi:glycosyltransferase involved in cell wall biosynthesis